MDGAGPIRDVTVSLAPRIWPRSEVASPGDTQHRARLSWVSGQHREVNICEVREADALHTDVFSVLPFLLPQTQRYCQALENLWKLQKGVLPNPGQTHPVDLAWYRVAAPDPLARLLVRAWTQLCTAACPDSDVASQEPTALATSPPEGQTSYRKDTRQRVCIIRPPTS